MELFCPNNFYAHVHIADLRGLILLSKCGKILTLTRAYAYTSERVYSCENRPQYLNRQITCFHLDC